MEPSPAPPRVPPTLTVEIQPVVVSVAGHTIRGEFTPATRELRIVTRPWSGTTFASPAAAAHAVVRYFAVGRPVRTLDRPVWRLAGSGAVLRATATHRLHTAAHRTAC
ncbi:hypothetical protein Q6348_02440 [Isoptericola sp. b441]|uniref:Uncharacterized protein n=1 Tax=Actinotalea lenta TaxID=3064654 RepID=A0ABT9D5J3_9CELL|nr:MULTISPECIES: hypothetical protein [unclassified Isoptericola]MDO8106051.1 hypothetical protein [Isoptericola sp. b441]MDO8122230.1 hypothetical protein [Isoptericola sp. b490]